MKPENYPVEKEVQTKTLGSFDLPESIGGKYPVI